MSEDKKDYSTRVLPKHYMTPSRFMDMMQELIILDLPGWDLSSGIKREIEFYKSRGQKVSLWSEVVGEFN